MKSINEVNKLIDLLCKGRSILFTGSGFSRDSIGISEKNLPLASELSSLLCKELQIAETSNLSFVADYFIDQKGKSALVEYLNYILTVKQVTQSQNEVCSINWMRIYTTNYDNSIELAYRNNNKSIVCVDIETNRSEYIQRKDLCIHLNGMLSNLNENDFESKFKLTDSSYVSSDKFLSSEWNYVFKTDLERASVILFVGYSLYDIEVKKLLKSTKDFNEKTFFITHKEPSVEERFTLEKYGTVLNIGLEGLAKIIEENIDKITKENNEKLSYLNKYHISFSGKSIHVDDERIREMLIYGKCNEHIFSSRINGNHQPYFIKRHHLEKTYNDVSLGKNVIITSKLGNGKSIFLQQVMPYFYYKGDYDIYEVYYQYDDIYHDIEKIGASNVKSVFILDDYENFLDIINFIVTMRYSNISIVATARSTNHIYHKNTLPTDFIYNNIDIDFLTVTEKDDLVAMLNNLGSWNYLSHINSDKKFELIDTKYNSEISNVLVGMFDSDVIKNKIKDIFNKLGNKPEYKTTLFSIILCKRLNIKVDRALISDISKNDIIYSSEFEKTKIFQNFFSLEQGVIKGTSSVLALFLMKNFFNPQYIVQSFLSIAKTLDVYKDRKNLQQDKIFKSMLKFSFIESSLPDKDKLPTLKNYYQELKKSVKWLETDPHFWLQYAMCHIAMNKFSEAQDLLNTSYSLARNKIGYDLHSIDNQQVRLWLLCCEGIDNGKEVFRKFREAHSKLDKTPNDSYKFRRFNDYVKFYENNYYKLSKRDKKTFVDILKHQKKIMSDLISHDFDYYSLEYNHIKNLESRFNDIISEASN